MISDLKLFFQFNGYSFILIKFKKSKGGLSVFSYCYVLIYVDEDLEDFIMLDSKNSLF